MKRSYVKRHFSEDKVSTSNVRLQPISLSLNDASIDMLLIMLRSVLANTSGTKETTPDTGTPTLKSIETLLSLAGQFLAAAEPAVGNSSAELGKTLYRLIEYFCSAVPVIVQLGRTDMLKTLVNIVCGLALFRDGSCGDVLALVVSLLKSFQIEDDCKKKVTGAGTRIVMTSFDRVLMYDDFHGAHVLAATFIVINAVECWRKGAKITQFLEGHCKRASDGKHLWVFNGQTGDLLFWDWV